MRRVSALLLAILIGCTPTKDAETTEFERQVREDLDKEYLGSAAEAIDTRIKKHGVDKVAPLVVEILLAKWPTIEKVELDRAASIGKDRALGKKWDCTDCTRLGKTLDALAPASPDLGARWKTLRSKIEEAESAAHEKEKSDKRPIVFVWPQGSGTTQAALQLISICFITSLEKAFPNYKWVANDKPPQGEAAQFAMTGKTATDKYVDTRTNKEAGQLLSGLRVTIVARHLDATLAPRFTTPLEAISTAESPDTIRSDLPIGGPPTMEIVRAGTAQLERIQTAICSTLDKQVQQAASADKAAPPSSEKR